jgi:transposase InsO family protein
VTTQDSTAAINFIKSIVFRFRVPHSIITDNGTNFTSKKFKSYYESLGIKLKFASVAHPKTNGQVEKANGLICNGIKKRLLAPLEKSKNAWVDELPSVLWSLQTTPNTATQETPFFLVHGAEAVLPVEITHEAPRIAVTWICPLGTRGLVYRVWPIKEVDRHKDSKMTWRRRRKVLIRIRLGSL